MLPDTIDYAKAASDPSLLAALLQELVTEARHLSERVSSESLIASSTNVGHPRLEGDVGYDLYADVSTRITPHSFKVVSSGSSVHLPDGVWGLILPRSSANRRGLLVLPGVIDTGYRGVLTAMCWNMTEKEIEIAHGTAIAQMVLLPSIVFPLVVGDVSESTVRGASGFGSTGSAVEHGHATHLSRFGADEYLPPYENHG